MLLFYSPIVKINLSVAKMLRKHKHLILNWFKADGRLSSGTVEGLNLKAKLTMRKAYGYKSLDCLQTARI